jgi:glycosyltransferase involved in cell wall biosynthesis
MFTYLRQGDLFICASEQQLDYWLGALMAAGRINSHTLENTLSVDHLIAVVPFGLSNIRPKPNLPVMKGVIPGITPQDKVLFWGGGIWEWTDPLGLMEAFKLLLRERDDLRIVFGAQHHFEDGMVSKMPVTAQLMDYIGQEGWLDKYVFFLDWIPYDQIGTYLLEADLGVSLFKQSIENRFAIRSRLFDYLWAECPCVISDGDYLSKLLGKMGLAKVVTPGDPAGTASAILNSLEHDRKDTRISRKYAAKIKQMYWSSSVRPILAFLREPRYAPDGEMARRNLHYIAPLRRDWNEIRAERDHLRSQLEIVSAAHIKEQDLFQQERDQLRSQLEILSAAHLKELDVFQRERDTFQQNLEASLADRNACQEAQENCSRALEEAKKESEALQAEIKSARQENTQLSHEYEKLQAELEAYRNRRAVRFVDYAVRLINRIR